MEKKHTLNDVLKRLVVDIDNMNSFLFSLENILESKSENVNISQTKDDGSSFNITVPSFGYLKGKIEDINSKFDTLLSANSDVLGIKSSNGDVRKFELKKTSQLIQDLENIQNSSFEVPSEFGVQNNWFFESFLNPLLFISLDISSILTDDIDTFSIKRIIINSVNNDDSADFFDDNYLNTNDINLDSLILDLQSNSIDYFEDDNIVEVDTAINRFRGSFDVLRILEEENIQELSSGDDVLIIRRRYKLSTLNYTDVLSGVKNSLLLSEGDVLITQNDSEYIVRSVNKTDNEIVLERIFGIDPITIGAKVLQIKPVPYRSPELKINVGFNERQIIFIRPISKAKNFTIDSYSNGVAIFTNNLTIPLPDNTIATLDNYYNNFVADFGLILLGLAKDKKLPAAVGVEPTAPELVDSNFKVVQIDGHIQNDQTVTQVSSTIKEKASIEKEIVELNKKIDEIKSSIIASAKTKPEAKRLEKQLAQSQKEREEKTTNLSTIVTDLTLQISAAPQFNSRKKYSVRGFWQIPTPIKTTYGDQNVVQFKYRYRYLSQTGNQSTAQQQEFIDSDGTAKTATFSPWEEILGKPRKKIIDPATGLYVWEDENITDSDSINCNQLDIPIRKGEIVEVQVKSISEAGWPENALESEWSNPVQISFPESISSEEDSMIVSQKAFADKTRLDFEASLISRGLDTHLANQFTTGERFFAHKTQEIASGFFTNEGNVIDLFEKLNSLSISLEGIQKAIELDRGVIRVSIIDSDGVETEIVNGDTISLFAGYYRDLIKDTTGGTTVFREGKIITKQYSISIQNTSSTPLELISLLFGGIGQLSNTSDPIANPDQDYHVNRRYDIAPIGVNKNSIPQIGEFRQTPSLQSGQVRSQFINVRVRDYGLSEELYSPSDISTFTLTSPYSYAGQTVGSTLVPYNWGHYLPFFPLQAVPGTSTDTRVWNGAVISGVGQGGGNLTEFCISKDHPALTQLGTITYIASTIQNLFRPAFDSTTPPTVDSTSAQKILPFAHGLHFETSVSEDTNPFGVKYYKQVSRVTPDIPTDNTTRNDSHYPIKLGFSPNDEYLIGKYSCGAYLYMFPLQYEDISVTGNFPARATKQITFGSENSINIPVLFQFRCSDRLGNIGGFRVGSTLNNIKYQKKIGIDIIVKDNVPFSFDLEISSQYTKETSLDAPLVQGKGKIKTF
jgi:hypothetical protein